MEKLVKDNPTLNQLLLKGLAISTPFPTNGGGDGHSKKFEGERFPTYFRFKNHKVGEELRREAHINERTRVSFETDAEDSYFVREIDSGAWNIRRRDGDSWADAVGWLTTGPKDGVAQLWFDSLPEGAAGRTLEYLIEVTDPSRIDAFELKLVLDVASARERTSTSGTNGSRNANNGKGKRGSSNGTLSLPKITPVRRADWGEHSFTETTALKIVHAGTDENESAYDFYVNYDNKYLLHSCKQKGANVDLLEKQFVYGLVLVGLALLQEHQTHNKADRPASENIEDVVQRTTAAIGPILVPMIQALGGLTVDA